MSLQDLILVQILEIGVSVLKRFYEGNFPPSGVRDVEVERRGNVGVS